MRGLTFRLGLLYMALFSVSVLALGALVYWKTVQVPITGVQQRIQSEIEAIRSQALSGQHDALADALSRRAAGGGARVPYHALVTSGGSVITSNLPQLPPQREPGWSRIDAKVEQGGELVDHEALVSTTRLPDGTWLLVGRDIEDLDEVEEKLLTAVLGVVTGALLLGAGGGMLASLVISRRLRRITRTARQIMEGDLSQRVPVTGSRDEFEALSETLNRMLERNEELFESVRRVSDNVAHELRTPLSRLRARLEELESTSATGVQAAMRAALGEVASLEKTFDAVLRIARIESGRHDRRNDRVDVSGLLRDAVDLYQPAAEERGQVLTSRIEEHLFVDGDRHLLFQAVCNLLDNAIKYGPEGGTVAMVAESRAGDVDICVSDEGPGIEPAYQARVMERFYRIPATAGAAGAGLGLSLVAAVVDRHRSRLQFENRQRGLTVRWTLPRAAGT